VAASKPYGPPRPVTGITLHFTMVKKEKLLKTLE
jgi:hypothetical protein